jgi:hypothetical protein
MKWAVRFPRYDHTFCFIRVKFNQPLHRPVMNVRQVRIQSLSSINRIVNNHIKTSKIINMVSEHKHLGLTISNDGNGGKHVDLITKKSFTRINIMRKFKFILDRRTLEKIYLTFIRPVLELTLKGIPGGYPR